MNHITRKPFGKKQTFATEESIRFHHDAYDEAIEDGDDVFDADITSRVDVDSVISLTARLAQVLAEEADLLAEMRVREIEGLQKEKLQLLDALEAQKRFIDRNPEVLAYVSDEDGLELAQIIEIFQTVMKENHRRLLIAREVNRKVVEAITEVMADAAKNGMYDKKGLPERTESGLSMSLNQTI